MKCIKCKLDGDEASFFPNNKMCKMCIKTMVRARNETIFDKADRCSREQEAVRHVISQIQDNKPFVYLIEHDNHYKIGFSRNINKRVKSFNTSHAIPCKIIAVAPGDSSLESQLHEKFSLHRIKGEWFLKKAKIIKEFKTIPDVMIFLPGQTR